jgi:hypothetical protein
VAISCFSTTVKTRFSINSLQWLPPSYTQRQQSLHVCTRSKTIRQQAISSNHMKSWTSLLLEEKPQTAIVALRTSLYITSIGVIALLFPSLLIKILWKYIESNVHNSIAAASLPAPLYVQVGGTLAMLFGFYYLGAALDDIDGRYPLYFYRTTVAGRYFLAIVCTILFLTQGVQQGWLLVVSVMNAVSAVVMHKAMLKRRSVENVTDGED